MERLVIQNKAGSLCYNDTDEGLKLEPNEITSHQRRLLLERLHEYEDIGLTPPEIAGKMEALRIYKEQGLTPDQIAELKERDTAKAPEVFDGHWYKCPTCGMYAGGLKGNFCHRCGQRLKWED